MTPLEKASWLDVFGWHFFRNNDVSINTSVSRSQLRELLATEPRPARPVLEELMQNLSV